MYSGMSLIIDDLRIAMISLSVVRALIMSDIIYYRVYLKSTEMQSDSRGSIFMRGQRIQRRVIIIIAHLINETRTSIAVSSSRYDITTHSLIARGNLISLYILLYGMQKSSTLR